MTLTERETLRSGEGTPAGEVGKHEAHEEMKRWVVMSMWGHCAHGRLEQTTHEGMLVLARG